MNAIAYWQSGLPFTVTNSTARANTGGTDRPNQIADPGLDQPTIAQWFNTSAFGAQPANTAGNTGRNALYGPPQRRLDMSLFKNLLLGDTMRLQRRVEAFNVTNTPNFANLNAALGAPGFGSITPATPSRGRCNLPRSWCSDESGDLDHEPPRLRELATGDRSRRARGRERGR